MAESWNDTQSLWAAISLSLSNCWSSSSAASDSRINWSSKGERKPGSLLSAISGSCSGENRRENGPTPPILMEAHQQKQESSLHPDWIKQYQKEVSHTIKGAYAAMKTSHRDVQSDALLSSFETFPDCLALALSL